ncbi:hypothetical protein EJB05_44782, partial [Eragrostis curvula]
MDQSQTTADENISLGLILFSRSLCLHGKKKRKKYRHTGCLPAPPPARSPSPPDAASRAAPPPLASPPLPPPLAPPPPAPLAFPPSAASRAPRLPSQCRLPRRRLPRPSPSLPVPPPAPLPLPSPPLPSQRRLRRHLPAPLALPCPHFPAAHNTSRNSHEDLRPLGKMTPLLFISSISSVGCRDRNAKNPIHVIQWLGDCLVLFGTVIACDSIIQCLQLCTPSICQRFDSFMDVLRDVLEESGLVFKKLDKRLERTMLHTYRKAFNKATGRAIGAVITPLKVAIASNFHLSEDVCCQPIALSVTYSARKARRRPLVQIALLCVQENPDDRPRMQEVTTMLCNNEVNLRDPAPPAYFNARLGEEIQNNNTVYPTAPIQQNARLGEVQINDTVYHTAPVEQAQ